MGNVDLRLSALAEGGNFFDDFDGTIKDARFVTTSFNGKVDPPRTVLQIVFDISGNEHTEFYSVGGDQDFIPDDTGMGLDYLGSTIEPTKKTKYGLLLISLKGAGFPENKMDSDNISYLVGLDGHWLSSAMKITGTGFKKNKDGKGPTVMLCTKVNKLPWEAGAKATGKGKKKGAAVPADSELAKAVMNAVRTTLPLDSGSIAKKAMLSMLLKVEWGDGITRKEAINLAKDDTFLGESDCWLFENGELTAI